MAPGFAWFISAQTRAVTWPLKTGARDSIHRLEDRGLTYAAPRRSPSAIGGSGRLDRRQISRARNIERRRANLRKARGRGPHRSENENAARTSDPAVDRTPQRRHFKLIETRRAGNLPCQRSYLRCLARCLFISNMLTLSRPPNTGFSLASATISRLLAGFCRLFVLM